MSKFSVNFDVSMSEFWLGTLHQTFQKNIVIFCVKMNFVILKNQVWGGMKYKLCNKTIFVFWSFQKFGDIKLRKQQAVIIII